MKKIAFCFLAVILCANIAAGQNNITQKINLNFENISGKVPVKWSSSGTKDYTVGIDSSIYQSGKYSAFIEFTGDSTANGYGAISLEIPNGYEGHKLKLTGYIKTENVTLGQAGMFMRIDPSVDDMWSREITGTTDWTKCEITINNNLAIDEKIVLGGILVGNGKMWIDNLELTIDDKDIQTLKTKDFPASTDKEFDNGSQIPQIQLNDVNKKTLKDLGLIWGFVKYYHPNVAAGNYNMDYELFRILPKILDVSNMEKRDSILTEWVHSFGLIKTIGEVEKILFPVKIEPDLDWIQKSGFSPELTNALTNIKAAKRTNSHYYISLAKGVGNPVFKNENSYAAMKYSDSGFRLLSLYRYWNIIQYFFPYKDLIGQDWKNTLDEFIPKFIDASDQKNYTFAVLEIIASIHDTHANIWGNNKVLNDWKGINIAAPILKFVENKAVVTSFFNNPLGSKSGLKVGDIVTEINNIPVDKIVAEKLKRTPASNYPTQLRDIASGLLKSNDSIINIRYIRDNKKAKAVIPAYSANKMYSYKRDIKPDTSFMIMPDNIAYLFPQLLKRGEIIKLWEKIKDTKGFIIDLRCYPSDFIVFSLGAKLMPEATPFVKFGIGSITTPGLFCTSPVALSVGGKNNDYYKGKVVILINENTQSQAEYTTMAFRVAPNATVIGSTTAGADGNVSFIQLPGEIRSGISGIGIYYPNGDQTQRIGIVPDIKLTPTIKGIKEGRDELLEKAVEVILKK